MQQEETLTWVGFINLPSGSKSVLVNCDPEDSEDAKAAFNAVFKKQRKERERLARLEEQIMELGEVPVP